MNYQRLLVLMPIDSDPQPVVATIRRCCPSAALITVVAQQAAHQLAWLMPVAPPDLHDAVTRTLDRLREAMRPLAAEVEVAPASDLAPRALAAAVNHAAIELVVVGAPSQRVIPLVTGFRRWSAAPVLWARSAPAGPDSGGGSRLLCLGLSAQGRRSIATFLRDHAGPGDRAILVSPTPFTAADLADVRQATGIPASVELIDGSSEWIRRAMDPAARRAIDVVVVPRFPPAALLNLGSGPPVLILPTPRSAIGEGERGIDVPDLVDDGALIRVRVEDASRVGRRTPIADQELGFVRGGALVARATTRRGEAELPSGIGDVLGVLRTHGRETPDPLARVEQHIAVLRAGRRPLILVDAEIEKRRLSPMRRVADADVVGVRVRSTRSCSALRAKLRAAGLPPRVIDAGVVLGEGEAPDVPALADAVRLARAAARMRADGFPIAAIVYRGPHRPQTAGFDAVRPEDVPKLVVPAGAAPHRLSVVERLDATTGSASLDGNAVEVELDNATARHWLLAAINGSERRVHFQVYMALDDDVGGPVEAALAAAGARGVTVRVLVDSLHGLEGSFGARNPLLERLASRPGVELRVSKPITGPPTLEDLKQRDHRKLAVADGRVALIGGRNLSHEYYTGFGEAPLTADSTWRMVPWLDAGARVEGPAVAALERSFLEAWTDAGGAPFEIPPSVPAGATRARVVVHRGLRDAHTIEAYLALIETARSHVYAVNGFPLLLEIQHALLRALGRGVRVRTLFGNLTPRHGDVSFRGPWAAARTAATSLVHSRMDALVAAGGECYELVVPNQPGWDRALGDVRPHVHAKAMSADGRVCAVGSANLDITAGYWENELLLVIEDEAIAGAVEARFDALMAASDRVDRSDPGWLRRAEQRQWMTYWPGVLSV